MALNACNDDEGVGWLFVATMKSNEFRERSWPMALIYFAMTCSSLMLLGACDPVLGLRTGSPGRCVGRAKCI